MYEIRKRQTRRLRRLVLDGDSSNHRHSGLPTTAHHCQRWAMRIVGALLIIGGLWWMVSCQGILEGMVAMLVGLTAFVEA